jgi:hypothetical protein
MEEIMALSRFAEQLASEISSHDWSDAPWRLDRAGHDRSIDKGLGHELLTAEEAENVKVNVMWVTAQVLLYADPNFHVGEFAVACGISKRITHRSDGKFSGALAAGLRTSGGRAAIPGTWEYDD